MVVGWTTVGSKYEGGTDGGLANLFQELLQEGRGIASSGHSLRCTGGPIFIPKREDGGFGEGERSAQAAVPITRGQSRYDLDGLLVQKRREKKPRQADPRYCSPRRVQPVRRKNIQSARPPRSDPTARAEVFAHMADVSGTAQFLVFPSPV